MITNLRLRPLRCYLHRRIRQRTFETAAGLNAHLPVLYKNEENRAVIAAALADSPGAVDLLGIVIQRSVLRQLRINHNNELVCALALKIGQLLV